MEDMDKHIRKRHERSVARRKINKKITEPDLRSQEEIIFDRLQGKAGAMIGSSALNLQRTGDAIAKSYPTLQSQFLNYTQSTEHKQLREYMGTLNEKKLQLRRSS